MLKLRAGETQEVSVPNDSRKVEEKWWKETGVSQVCEDT